MCSRSVYLFVLLLIGCSDARHYGNSGNGSPAKESTSGQSNQEATAESSHETATEAQPTGAGAALSCVETQKDIKAQIDLLRSCSADSDCVRAPYSGCPYGCGLLIHADADFSDVLTQLQAFGKTCGKCNFDCGYNFKNHVNRCVNNRCEALPK